MSYTTEDLTKKPMTFEHAPQLDMSVQKVYPVLPADAEEDGLVDEIDCGELTCDNCDCDECEVTCPEHGDQEIAMLSGSRLRCSEWDYSTGRMCSLPLEVVCKACGNDEVQI